MTHRPLVVTGAEGFIGRHLLNGLRDYHGVVLAVDRVEGVAGNGRYHQSDLSDPSDLIPADVDVSAGFTLIHLAWDTHRGRSFAAQAEQARLFGGLLDYWTDKGLRAVIGMGSAEEYGVRGGLIHEYDLPMEPLSPYGAAKRLAGVMARSWALREKRDVVWLRPFIVYGPGQAGDMMLPYAVAQARKREAAKFTDGMQERDFVYVDDVVDAFCRVIDRRVAGVQVLNLGGGQPVRVRDVLIEVARSLDAESLFKLGARPRRPGEPDRQVADIQSARDLLGWSPKIDWREGVKRIVNG